MTGRPRHQNKLSGCDGKVKFESMAIARRAAKRREARMAYHCEFCAKFHVGQRPIKRIRKLAIDDWSDESSY